MRTGNLSVRSLGHRSQGNGRSHQAGAAAWGILKLNCGCSLAREAEKEGKHRDFPAVQRAADPLQSATVTCWGSSSSGPVPAPALRVRRCGSTCCGTAVQGLSVGKGKCCSASAETRPNRERAESRGRSCLHTRGHRRARNATAVICGRVFGTRWLTRGGRDRCQTLSLSGASSPLCVVLYLLLNKGSVTSNWAGPALREA